MTESARPPRISVYVVVQNVPRVGLATESLLNGELNLDWQRRTENSVEERLINVEVLGARSVEVNGVRVDSETAARAAEVSERYGELCLELGVPAMWSRDDILDRARELVNAEAGLPERGDGVESWLTRARSRAAMGSPEYWAFDQLLDDYRLHADLGAALSEAVSERDLEES